MPVDLAGLTADLAAESADLVAVVAPLSEQQWSAGTPAPGWTVKDQLTHLAYFDEAATTAATDPDRFVAETGALLAGGLDFPDRIAARHRALSGAEVLAWFERARAAYLETFAGLPPEAKLPWYGPPMSAASAVTARLMETWAHGQDVADALGVVRPPTDRLRHVAHLAVRALPFSYAVHGRPAPTEPVRVELTAPGGELWTWGPPGTPDVVRGTALDFCLLVTQRRHRDDLELHVGGPVAAEWLSIAQAFAGPPGTGRTPLRTRT
jgi:uncharacterized protein (TIGR03084 family)